MLWLDRDVDISQIYLYQSERVLNRKEMQKQEAHTFWVSPEHFINRGKKKQLDERIFPQKPWQRLGVLHFFFACYWRCPQARAWVTRSHTFSRWAQVRRTPQTRRVGQTERPLKARVDTTNPTSLHCLLSPGSGAMSALRTWSPCGFWSAGSANYVSPTERTKAWSMQYICWNMWVQVINLSCNSI